jgi:hypothetical protein
MKTQEQQKAELLDELMHYCSGAFSQSYAHELLTETKKKHNQITQQKPLSQDPYIDEVFSRRLLRIIKIYWACNKETRLSELPSIDWFCHDFGFGKMSKQEYIEVMTKYNLTDKL